MRRHNTALGFIVALVLGTFFSGLRANGQNTLPGTPVHMVVTVESRHGAKLPEITREDVVVTEGHDREKVTEWLPAIGEHAGLDLYVLVDDSSSWSLETRLGELRAFIMQQPPSTFIAIGYMRNGTVETVQDLTQDHASAAKAVRLPLGNSAGAASPYFSMEDLINRWQPNPARPRREISLPAPRICHSIRQTRVSSSLRFQNSIRNRLRFQVYCHPATRFSRAVGAFHCTGTGSYSRC